MIIVSLNHFCGRQIHSGSTGRKQEVHGGSDGDFLHSGHCHGQNNGNESMMVIFLCPGIVADHSGCSSQELDSMSAYKLQSRFKLCQSLTK